MAITIPILTDFNSRGIDRGIKQFQKLETKGQKAGFLIRKAALPAALALGGIALAAKAGLDGVMADDEALANLQSTITSTGNAANITSESFFAYANQLQKVTGTGADQITQGAALLATFKNVRNETGKGNQVFNRATKAALDLSKKGFGDLSGSNKMLGKALNDPIRGITALSRAGVTFTDEQKATIKTLQESGRTLDAQKIILKEVEDQVGGTAEAFGATTRGKIERSKRAFEEMQKTLARALLPDPRSCGVNLPEAFRLHRAEPEGFQDHHWRYRRARRRRPHPQCRNEGVRRHSGGYLTEPRGANYRRNCARRSCFDHRFHCPLQEVGNFPKDCHRRIRECKEGHRQGR
jgi:hypothetical protein